MALILAIGAGSCATARLDPSLADHSLKQFKSSKKVSFSGIGQINIRGGGSRFSGSITLALQGSKYRIEIYDSIGRAIFAAAGESDKMISINPATGERKITADPSANMVTIDNFRIPVSTFSAITLGDVPEFEKVASLTMENEKYVAKTDGPRMQIVYGDTIESITLFVGGAGDDSIEISLGERAEEGGYVTSAVISFDYGLGKAKIVWNKVKLNKTFPARFFSFNEPLD